MLEPEIGGLHELWDYALQHLRTRVDTGDKISVRFPVITVSGAGLVTFEFKEQGWCGTTDYVIAVSGEHANAPDRKFRARMEIQLKSETRAKHKKTRYIVNKGLRARAEPPRTTIDMDLFELYA